MADNVAERVQKQIESLRGMDLEQYTASQEDASALSFFSGLLLGVIVGVIVAILLAPQPGSNTRQQVKQTGIELLPRGQNGDEDA